MEPDDLSGSFVSLTSAKTNPKPFVVGFVPPQGSITGRLLDRANSLSQQKPTENTTPTPSTSKATDTTDPGNTTPHPGGVPSLSDTTDPRVNPRLLPPSFWDRYIQMCNRLGVDPKELARVLFAESGFRSGHVNYVLGKDGKPTNQAQAKGFNQIIKSMGVKAVGMTPEQWDAMETESPDKNLEYTEGYFKKVNIKGQDAVNIYAKNFGGYPNKDGSRYANRAAQDRFLSSQGLPLDDEAIRNQNFPNAAKQDNDVKQNPGLDKDGDGRITTDALAANLPVLPVFLAQALDDAQARVGSDKGISSAGAVGSTDWAKSGSQNARQSASQNAALAGKDLNPQDLGKRFMEAQRSTILALSSAVQQMASTPPLRMLVNPSTFKVAGEAVVNNSDWSRYGPIIQHAGHDQEKIEASGTVAAFFAQDLRGPGPGLTTTAAQFSKGYQNFLSLYLIYRNNGGIFLQGETGDETARSLSLVGSVFIYYDGVLYIGKFDNFSVTRTEEKPFSLEYSFSFSVSYSFLFDRVEDVRFTYNLPDRNTQLARSTKDTSAFRVQKDRELRVYQDLDDARLKAEAERVETQAREEKRRAYEAAAARRDQEIGVFSSSPDGDSTSKIIELLKRNPPKGSSLTLKKK